MRIKVSTVASVTLMAAAGASVAYGFLAKKFHKKGGSTAFAIAGSCMAAASIVYGYSSSRMLKKACDRLNTTIDQLADDTVAVDISQSVVDEAIRVKTDEEVNKMLPEARKAAMKLATAKFKDVVSNEINEQYSDIRSELKRAAKERIARIDIDDVKSEVIEEVKDDIKSYLEDATDDLTAKAERKLDDNMDDIIGRLSDKLDYTSKIYESIAKKFSND